MKKQVTVALFCLILVFLVGCGTNTNVTHETQTEGNAEATAAKVAATEATTSSGTTYTASSTLDDEEITLTCTIENGKKKIEFSGTAKDDEKASRLFGLMKQTCDYMLNKGTIYDYRVTVKVADTFKSCKIYTNGLTSVLFCVDEKLMPSADYPDWVQTEYITEAYDTSNSYVQKAIIAVSYCMSELVSN